MVQLKNNLYLPAPNVTLDYVKNRGFSVFGMSKMAYMYTSLTLGLEYVWNVALRIYKIYDRMGRFGCRITTRSEFYQAMINSSMICWMNLETGHLEFRNVRLAYKNDEIVDIPYCCIELDHEVNRILILKSSCNFTTYVGPKYIWSPDIWFPTNGPQPIQSPWTNVPQNFGPPG